MESSWGIRIEYHGGGLDDLVFQGHYSNVGIILDSAPDKSLDGFNFLIGYDDEALTFMTAEFVDATWCWEYFNYEQGPFEECGEDCPSGLVRLTGLRDVNYGPYHPAECEGADGFFDSSGTEIFNIKFYVTDDRNYECVFVPVYFYWLDCGDNTITCGGEVNELISRRVFELSWESGVREDVQILPPDGTVKSGPNIYGALDQCLDIGISAAIDFYNGGLDIACAYSIDNPDGDLNQNRIPYEVDDIILFADYFAYGSSVFTIDSARQRAASDVNNDWEYLTPADFVFMIRYAVTDDYIPTSHLQHLKDTVIITKNENILSINADTRVAAIWLVFDDSTDVSLMAENMDMMRGFADEEMRVLIYNLGPEFIPEGTCDILQLDHDADLIHIEAAGYYGNRLVSIIENP